MSHGILYNALKAVKPLRTLVRRLRRIWERYRLDAWVLEGAERTSGDPIRVLFVGQVENCNYLSRVVFGESPIAVKPRKIWKHRAWQLLAASDSAYGLIFIQTLDTPPDYAHRRDCYAIPSWVAGELDVAHALLTPRTSTSVKRDVRHVRSSRFAYRTTQDPHSIERFYSDMYLPYIQQTHCGGAVVATLDEFRREADKGAELLLVEQDGKSVAGVLLGLDDPARMEALELGVLGADRSLVKAGALAAIYYFSLLFAANGGYRRLFLGGARPFLNDGPLQYKKKWGLRLTGRLHTMPDVWIFRPYPASAAVQSYLHNNPFVFERDNTLRVAVFVGADEALSEVSIEHLRKAHGLPGITGVSVFRLGSEMDPQVALAYALPSVSEPSLKRVPAA
jgi:hypothetical protein